FRRSKGWCWATTSRDIRRPRADRRRRLDAGRARWLYSAPYDADVADSVARAGTGPAAAGPARSVRDLIERGTPRAGASPWLEETQGPRVADPWPLLFVVASRDPRRAVECKWSRGGSKH